MFTPKIAICDDDLILGNQARNEMKKLLHKNHVKHSISTFGTAFLKFLRKEGDVKMK